MNDRLAMITETEFVPRWKQWRYEVWSQLRLLRLKLYCGVNNDVMNDRGGYAAISKEKLENMEIWIINWKRRSKYTVTSSTSLVELNLIYIVIDLKINSSRKKQF